MHFFFFFFFHITKEHTHESCDWARLRIDGYESQSALTSYYYFVLLIAIWISIYSLLLFFDIFMFVFILIRTVFFSCYCLASFAYTSFNITNETHGNVSLIIFWLAHFAVQSSVDCWYSTKNKENMSIKHRRPYKYSTKRVSKYSLDNEMMN